MRTGWGDFHRDTFGSQGRFFINAIAESPEVVAADVVPRMRELVAKPGARKGNAAVRFLTPDKAIVKLYRRIAKVRVEVWFGALAISI
jgi:chlorophyll(ide) b reductase